MTDSMLDYVVVGLAIASVIPMAAVLLTLVRRGQAATSPRGRRALVVSLLALGAAHGVLALLRLFMDTGTEANGTAVVAVVLGCALAASTIFLGIIVSRSGEPESDRSTDERRMPPPLTQARTLDAPASDGGAPDVTVEYHALSVSESRLTGLLFEGSADAIGSPLPTDPAEFDARLMHANRMQSIGRLAGGIAHDFNNLLTSILTSAEMAQELLPEEHGVTPDLREIRRAGTRASELTRQLLAFARRDVSRPRVVDANALLGNLATMLRRLLGETITLRITLASELPLLHADPAQLEQVIVNLAVNARDAMPGGGELHIRTVRGYPSSRSSADGTGVGVVLEVQDSGLGMTKEVRARLFEPFFTTKHPGRGTGLGLATCHAIVVAHGGEIAVESVPSEGSTFRVWLPQTDENDEQRSVSGLAASRNQGCNAQQTILVVEDDADVRASTTRALRRAGYDVLEATDGEDALARLRARSEPVDLVVSDIVMPRMGGAAFVRELSTHWPTVRILFVSGYPGDAPDVRAVEALGLPVLEKPYTPSILLFEVRLRLDTARIS